MNKLLLLLILFGSFITVPSWAKILIFTYAYNRPEFIELQHKTFQKFLKDDYELIVFNDAQEKDTKSQINHMCKQYSIRCIEIPQQIHHRPYLDRTMDTKIWTIKDYNAPSVRNCNVVQYSLDTVGFKHDDIVVLFESDLFLIKEFSFREYLQHNDLAGYNRSVEYQGKRKNLPFLWIGIIIINMKTLPNKTMFNTNCGVCNDIIVDAGGHTHYYIKHNPHAEIKYFDKVQIQYYYCSKCEKTKSYRCSHNTNQLKKKGFNKETIQFIQQVPIDWGSGIHSTLDKRNIEFFLNNTLVHFYGGTGYATVSYLGDKINQFYHDKAKAFYNYIHTLLNQ